MCYSQKIDALDNLIDTSNGFLSSDLDSAMFYMKKAYVLNEKIGNNYYKSRCLYNFGNIYYNKNDVDKANFYVDKAIVYAEKSKNYKILARSYNLIGAINEDNAEYNNALKNYLIAIKYLSKTKDDNYLSIVYSNLGNVSISKKDTIGAIDYYELTKKYSLLSGDTLRLLGSYNNIALIESRKNKTKAENYLNKALYLAKKIHNNTEVFNIYINLSNLYIKDNPEKSLFQIHKAEKQINEIGDKNLFFYINFNLGGIYRYKNDYIKSIFYYKNAENIWNVKNISIEQKISLLESLYKIYELDKNYAKAFEYKTKFHKIKDSLFTIEKEKDYNRLFAKFEVEKKNNKINQLTQEKKIESLRGSRLLIISLLLSALVVAICIIFFQKLKSQKKLKEKEEKINISKGILEGQTEERIRLAKELHDGVAGSLVGINLMLEQENNIQESKQITEIQRNINSLYEEIRDISHDLRTGISENTDLQQLIRNLASGYERTKRFKTNLLFFPENIFSEINSNLKMDMYRIFQEIFTNTYKHSEAKNIDISCTQNSENINIIIEDDGKGFPENYTEGIGLKNIKERLNKYQGEMIMENSNQGSVITLNIPIK